ncbi:acetylcholine receptor subunit beta [Patella vulgata]|uniref:acetylcholine receptor subunit beta n=1 Tax=Patella vulgata TaxID=6465 RepID=UPI0021801603|nr:acetylcholine receptor subunit beta [Patella vulgata]
MDPVWTSFYCLLLIYPTFTDGFTIKDEALLRDKLFETGEYDLKIRPSDRVQVEILLNLMTINFLNIRDQSFQVSGWLTLAWIDKRLSWVQEEYGDIGFIFASQTEVWRPTLVISNCVQKLGIIQDGFTPLRITNSSKIIWEPPGIYEVSCLADTTVYPFDVQTCHLTIQSWGYALKELDVSALGSGINLEEYKENGEWDIIDHYTIRGESTDSRDIDYGQLSFYFTLQRKSQYYWFNVMLPVIVNSILTALVFALPAESGEKMGYSLTVLLSFAVLLTLVSDKIPPTSTHTSIMVVYFSFVLIMGALAVGFSILVIKLYFRENDEPISPWVQYFYKKILGRLVCYRKCKPRQNSVSDLGSDRGSMYEKGETPNMYLQREATEHKLENGNSPETDDDLDWKDLSKILDHFFLRLYLLLISFATFGFLAALSL